MEVVLWKERGSQCQGGIPSHAASASSKHLPVGELGLLVVWTFPRLYGLHLWFGSTTKTTREYSPTFGLLTGNSGQKTTSRQLELDQLVLHGLMVVLGMQMMLLAPFITPCALLAAAHLGMGRGGVSWQGLLRNVLKTWKDRRLSPKPSETPVLLWLSFLDALTAFLTTRPLAGLSKIVGFLHQKTKESQTLSIEFDCSCSLLCCRKHERPISLTTGIQAAFSHLLDAFFRSIYIKHFANFGRVYH